MNKDKIDIIRKYLKEFNLSFIKIINTNCKKGEYKFDIENNKIFINLNESNEEEIKDAVNRYKLYATTSIEVKDHVLQFVKEAGVFNLIGVIHPEDEKKCKLKIDDKFINNVLVAHGYIKGEIEV